MVLENGRVIAVDTGGLWVETIQLSVCGSCQAQKGCGQRALEAFGTSASQLWVLLEGRDVTRYCVGDEVRIGIPEDVITKNALFIYMVPLICMLTGTILAHQQAASDGVSVFWAVGGLMLGGCIVRWHAHRTRFDSRLQPILVEDQQNLRLLVEPR